MNLQKNFHLFFVNKEIVVVENSIAFYEQEICKHIQNNPNDLNSLIILEQIQFHYNQQYISALQTIKKGLQLDQQNIDLRLDLIEILISQKKRQIQDILKLFEECYAIDPGYWRCDYIKSLFGILINNDKLQCYSLQSALLKSPDNNLVKATLASYLAEMNSQKYKAKELLNNIEHQIKQREDDQQIQIQNKYTNNQFYNCEILRKMAITHYLLNNSKIAEEYFYKAYELNPKSSKILANIAQLERLQNQNYHKSIEFCKLALQYEPNNQLALFNCAISYDKLGEGGLFLQLIRQCLNLKKNKQNYLQLASYYWKRGNQNESIYYCKKLIEKCKEYIYPYYLYIQIQVNSAKDYEEYQNIIQNCFNLISNQFENNIHTLQFISNQTLFIYPQ